MNNENVYKDFINAVEQDSEICKDLMAELRYSNDKLELSCRNMIESISLQKRHLDYLEQRSRRLDMLFDRLCASNDKVL